MRYAEQLRLLGQVLDTHNGHLAEITIMRDGIVTLTWRAAGDERQERRYLTNDFEELHQRSLRIRVGLTPRPTGQRAVLLRALGQDFDRATIRVERIVEGADGYRVIGSQGRQPIAKWFPIDRLYLADQERQHLRNGPSRQELKPAARPRGHLPPPPADHT